VETRQLTQNNWYIFTGTGQRRRGQWTGASFSAAVPAPQDAKNWYAIAPRRLLHGIATQPPEALAGLGLVDAAGVLGKELLVQLLGFGLVLEVFVLNLGR